MGFYQQRVQVLRPARIAGKYGGDETLSYETADGARIIDVPFAVDMQPRTEVELGQGDGRITIQTGYTLHTPPGRDLDLTAVDRVLYAGRDLDVDGDVHRWPSADFPSGVDHVEVALTFTAG